MWRWEVGGERGGEEGEVVGGDSKDRMIQDKWQLQENYRLQFFTNQRYAPPPLRSSPLSFPSFECVMMVTVTYRWSQWA